jgi:hypothetical protein
MEAATLRGALIMTMDVYRLAIPKARPQIRNSNCPVAKQKISRQSYNMAIVETRFD